MPRSPPTNPRLVYCSISAYGRNGPFALRPGFDPITQAESGFMSLNGFPDGQPVRTGPPIVDLATGMSACNAILLALLARDRLGRGQHVEVALIDIAVAMTAFYGMAYLITGSNPGRFGNSPNGSPSVGVYEASDGPFYIACANDRLYRRLVTEVLERPDLVSDPQFATRKARTANREKLRAIIGAVFKADRLEIWMAKMKKANVPVGYLRTVEQGFNAPESARAAPSQPDSAPDRGIGAQHRNPAPSRADPGRRSRGSPAAGRAHQRGVARHARL